MPHMVGQMAASPQENVIVKQETLESTVGSCERCSGCGGSITDRFLLRVGGGLSWHMKCLSCADCLTSLDTQLTCYCRDSQVYCKHCYSRSFSTKCTGCARTIHSSDWVRRAKNHVYHLACFACDDCKRQLSTDSGSFYGCENGENRHIHKSKRIRTTFSEEQLEVLQANFNVDSNPDGQDLERIAQQTGLSKRVTQVWFQNSRARQKKHKDSPSDIFHGSASGDEDTRRDTCRKCATRYCLCIKEVSTCSS
ncbi:LIM/homeobox protein Awh-like isoform X2 [Asterias amurensis]|uniref:LIM/homeobox protein Awh-like isoform X2 n=1 Tax=Asterias amurensis TaxID=7602 RepID=UPI003AB340AA